MGHQCRLGITTYCLPPTQPSLLTSPPLPSAVPRTLQAFGIVEWGACGYTNSDGSLIFDQTRAAAYSDVNPDSGGSCGRCYEVRCSPGKVLGWEDAPVNFSNNFFPFW